LLVVEYEIARLNQLVGIQTGTWLVHLTPTLGVENDTSVQIHTK